MTTKVARSVAITSTSWNVLPFTWCARYLPSMLTGLFVAAVRVVRLQPHVLEWPRAERAQQPVIGLARREGLITKLAIERRHELPVRHRGNCIGRIVGLQVAQKPGTRAHSRMARDHSGKLSRTVLPG